MKKTAQRSNPPDSVIVGSELLCFLSHYQDAFVQKYQHYCNEEFSLAVEGQLEKRDSLAKEFSQYGVDFEKEIYPLFQDTYYDFVHYHAARRAIAETAREIRKHLKRYRISVQLLTEDEAPFPERLKEELKKRWAAFQAPDWEEKMLKVMRTNWGEYTTFVSGTTFTKVFHKHPAWKELEKKLYQLLTAQRVSQRQALRLIGLLLKTLVPHGFDAAYTEDTIRHRVTTRP